MTQLGKGPVESRQSSGGVVTVVSLVVSLALFIGGMFLFGFAFEYPDFATLIFASGLVAVTLGVFIPLQLLRHVDGA
ncbi:MULTISPECIES: hypothetical protein [Subtercola]|uniref:Uncharacterized protein n=1 Tax=Subtercola frigoramans TaxID=120298 RepID=A0ABS2L4I4_9MICO|nr:MULTISPECIES: hypothetical protein [Subtercola]MBM7471801.1 hypothetical protein [Subtercola frigoramans]QWT23665.1 hypothetical protein KPL76_13335 [Subtercola sp. PAMC28395]